MKKVALDKLAPGMKLARTVFAPDGRVMVASGTELNEALIAKLKDKGLPCAFIETEAQSRPNDDLVSEKTVSMLLYAMSRLEQELRSNQEPQWDKCKEPLFALIDEISSRRQRLFCPTDVRVNEAYIYGHSVNVTLLSVLIGTTLGYNSLKLKELALGALFHDVGMFTLPPEVLYKRGPLNQAEMRLVHEHPAKGFQILRGRQDITAVTANIAYQHHERLDGSGYPRKLSGAKILEPAQVVAVADVYDAMTSDRLYRPAMSSSRAVNYLRANSGFLFEAVVVAALVKNVAEYTVGSLVRLNNGQLAMVSRLNHEDGRRPIVQTSNGGEIDLLLKPEIFIVDEEGV